MQNQVPVIPLQNPMPKPKKRSRNKENWKRRTVKLARVKGQRYMDYKSNLIPAKVRQEVQCKCIPACAQKFTAAEKDESFTNYHKLANHEEQTLYLRGCIVKNRDTNNAYSNAYYIMSSTASVLVCQKFLLGHLGIKRSRLRCKVLNTAADVADMRGKHSNHHQVSPDALHAVRTFLHSLDARESHYSRQRNHQRKYLESNQSISSLYQQFITLNSQFGPYAVRNQNEPPMNVKKWIFERVFNYEFNIAFGYPRSDICRYCERNSVEQKSARLDNNQVLLDQLKRNHQLHLDLAEEFYKSISNDEVQSLNPDVACICFDFEKNLPLPVTNVTNEFFARQLWLYNFGIHDLRTGQTHMYIYSETFGRKGPNEVISALKHYIENFMEAGIRKVRFFSDNSSGQNKNRYLLGFLSSLNDRFQEVQMIFPVVGHSRMPCDRDFAQIEKLKRKQDKFYFPSDWTDLIKRAQSNRPFKLVYLEHPITDDLCSDGTMVAKCFDIKAVLDPLLMPPTGIMSRKGFIFDHNGQIMSRTLTSGPFNLNFQILKPGITANLLKQSLNLCPPAYQGYIPMKKAKLENIQMLLLNVHIPLEKIFYETLIQDTGNELSQDDLDELLDEDE